MAKFNFIPDPMDYHPRPDRATILEFHDYVFEKRKMNLGSNVDIRATHINVDILDFPGLDVRCDLTNLDQYMVANSLDELLCYDLLEHFPFTKTMKMLDQWVSWLAPGGKIIVRVPDLEKLANTIVNKTLPIWEIQRLIYGGQDYEFNFHMAGFVGSMVEGLLIGAGCSKIIQVVREPDTYNVTVVAIK